MAMQTIAFKLKGSTPLFMHNIQLANPFSKYSRKLGELNKAKKKKGADKYAVMLEMSEVEWEGGLYLDPDIGPYIPAEWVRANIVSGATMTRGGKSVERAVFVLKSKFPLQFNGPRDIEGLRADPRFRDMRPVSVGMSKVPRTRPYFEEWSCVIEIAYDDSAMDREDLIRYVNDGGLYQGFGDARNIGFGRFYAETLEPAQAK